MNQSNNNNFNPVNGQPINYQPQQPIQNQNIPNVNQQQSQMNNWNMQQPINQQMQQPMQNQSTPNIYSQPQQNFNGYQNTGQSQVPKKNNKIIIIVSIIVVIVVIVGILLVVNHDKKDLTNNIDTNDSQNDNNANKENNTIGSVDKETNTTYDENGAFLFSIEDVYTIAGRGTVVAGKVERGKVNVGDTVQIVGLSDEILTTEVIGVEMFRQQLDEAKIGDSAGIILKDVARDQVEMGQVLAQPNSIVSATKFSADVHILSKEEDGRHTPFFDGYRPQFYFRNFNMTGVVELPSDIEMVNPGDDVSFTVTLINNIAMEVGTEFSIKEGGKLIGTGKITKVY